MEKRPGGVKRKFLKLEKQSKTPDNGISNTLRAVVLQSFFNLYNISDASIPTSKDAASAAKSPTSFSWTFFQ
jgi:hypothetical protein